MSIMAGRARRAFEIIPEEEFLFIMRGIRAGSSWPISEVELLKRWLSIGMSYDIRRSPEQCAKFLESFARIEMK